MMKLILKRALFSGLCVLVGSGALMGCSLVQDVWNQDDIAEHGEAVFRRQNAITSQVMMLSDSDLSASNQKKLQQAESKMQQECKLLNEYATREMDKKTSDVLFQKQVRDSIEGCDSSIKQIENTLVELGIKQPQ